MVVIARDKDEPYVAGDEGIGNRRDRPAVEIGVEDRKIEVGLTAARFSGWGSFR